MKLITMLFLLAGILMMMLGIKYDERAGERRDQLPIGWFGGILFRGVQAYPIGTGYDNRFAAPESSSVPQITANQTDVDAYFLTAGENIYSVPGSIPTCPIDSFTDFKNIIEDKISGIKQGIENDFQAIINADPCQLYCDNEPFFTALLDAAADLTIGTMIKCFTDIYNFFTTFHHWLLISDLDNAFYARFMGAGVTFMTFPRFMSGLFFGAIAWGMPEFVSEWLSAFLMHMLAEELAIGLICLCKSAVAGGIGREVFNYFMRVVGMTLILVAFVGMAIGMLNKY